MKLRVACKVCRTLYGCEKRDMDRQVRTRYRRRTVAEATRVCRRKWLSSRTPYVPSEDELRERAEIFGCLLIDFAEYCGAPKEECDRKKEEFLVAMSR